MFIAKTPQTNPRLEELKARGDIKDYALVERRNSATGVVSEHLTITLPSGKELTIFSCPDVAEPNYSTNLDIG